MPKPKKETAARVSDAQEKPRAKTARRDRSGTPEQTQEVPKRTRAPRAELPAAHNTTAQTGARKPGRQAARPPVSPAAPEAAPELTEQPAVQVAPVSETPARSPRRGPQPRRATDAPTAEADAPALTTESSAVTAEQPEPITEPETAPTEQILEATPAPARKTRGRKPRASEPQKDTTPAEPAKQETPAVMAAETPQAVEADVPAAVAAAEPEPEPADPKPRRGGRKPRQVVPEPVVEAAAEPEVTQPDAEPSEPEAVTAPVSEAPAPRRGRGKRSTAPQAEVAPVQPEPTAEPEVQTPDAEPDAQPEALEAQALEPVTESAPTPRRGRKPRGAAPAGDAPSSPSQPARPARGGRKARPPVTPDVQATPAAETAEPEIESAAEPAQVAESPAVTVEPREAVLAQLRTLGRPMHVRDFERSFPRDQRRALGNIDFEDVLQDLMREGQVVRTRRRTYGLPEAMNLVRGRFQASASGFGFVIPEAGGTDYYVAPDATMDAWNGDTVLVRPEGQGKRDDSPRATVVRIVTRAATQLVGTLERARGYALIKADDLRARHRVMLAPDGLDDVKGGSRIVAKLYWPEQTGEDEVYGMLTQVLGETDDPETETRAVVVKYGLHDEFPPEVLREAEKIATRIPKTALKGRLDLRSRNVFTVDGADAKDFDDAIHIEPLDGGRFRVGVHIADVSHYVKAGGPLDTEAFERATSVYLPGHVLPMLPEHLSNGVCSLVPGEDRLTLSAMIEVNADGDVLDYQLTPSVIHSQARLTYDEVQAYSEARGVLPEHARRVEGDLHLLLKLTSRMRQKRLRAGSLDFQMREVKVDVDREGNLHLIPIREETARGMIEDLMLLANQVVARYLLEKNAPALYRVHEEPTHQRFAEVSTALARMGITLGDSPTPQAYQQALKQVRGTPQESPVNQLLLRSLKQARYSAENLGHFGLAFEEYLHFTSPIRRYPDLVVHRMLRAYLTGQEQSALVQSTRAELPGMADHTSDRERKAAEAERDLTKYYQAKWAQAHLGETFTGTVSGVTSFGLFVALENGVEGLLHISHLDDDYYVFIEDALMLRGRSGGRTYRLGTEVGVLISQVNPLARQIDFTQENDMNSGIKARARTREEREQAKRERQGEANGPAGIQADQNAQPRKPREEGGAPQGQRRGPQQGQQGGRGVQRSGAAQGGGNRRRIVTLDRPRNEHARPVNVTVHRMYFGDWSLDNMPTEDDDRNSGGGNYRGGRPSGGRPQAQAARTGGPRPQQGQAPQRQASAPAPAPSAAAGSDADANKRRRRRRGRRKGNGSEG